MTQVAVQRCSDYSSAKDKVAEAFQLHGGIEKFISRGDKVLLKPNLLAAPKTPDEPVTTKGEFIYAVAELLHEHGARLTVGDGPAFGLVEKILKEIDVLDRLKALNADIVDFSRADNLISPHGRDKALKEADKIINLPKLKVHCQLFLTLSVKNLFGCFSGKRKSLLHFVHGDKKNNFAEALVKNYDIIRPTFTLVDAIVAMNKMGPQTGEPKDVGLIFSGVDCVAIDRVILEVLGINPDEYKITEAAAKMGIGEVDINKIQILGESALPSVTLDYPEIIPIRFSLPHVVRSIQAGLIEKKRQLNEI